MHYIHVVNYYHSCQPSSINPAHIPTFETATGQVIQEFSVAREPTISEIEVKKEVEEALPVSELSEIIPKEDKSPLYDNPDLPGTSGHVISDVTHQGYASNQETEDAISLRGRVDLGDDLLLDRDDVMGEEVSGTADPDNFDPAAPFVVRHL